MSENNAQTGTWAIVVTYNRIELLKECVKALREQTRRVDHILVVNNDSTDGTCEWLDSQTDLDVLHQGNLGGAGGFHNGIEYAYHQGAEYFWLMDDDAICHTDAYEKLCDAKEFLDVEGVNYGFIHSFVLNSDGKQQFRRGFSASWGKYVDEGLVEIIEGSFVGFFVPLHVVLDVGLPYKEFFFQYDDTEYSLRISDERLGYIVLDSRIDHKTKVLLGDVEKITSSNVGKLELSARNQTFLRTSRGERSFFIKDIFRYLVKALRRRDSIVVISKLVWARINGALFFKPEIVQIEKSLAHDC